MIIHQYIPRNEKMSWMTKLSLVIWIVIALSLLFVFTFTMFIIAVMAGVVILALNLYRNARMKIRQDEAQPAPTAHVYHAPRSREDDVIDI